MLNLWDNISKWGKNVQEWVIEHGNSPYFWLIIFFTGLIIGAYAIHTLNKEK